MRTHSPSPKAMEAHGSLELLCWNASSLGSFFLNSSKNCIRTAQLSLSSHLEQGTEAGYLRVVICLESLRGLYIWGVREQRPELNYLGEKKPSSVPRVVSKVID